MERASETPRSEAPSARTNSTGEMSPTAPLTVSAMALRDLCADGLGEEPCASHRLVLWISVMSVESDHLNVGGDKRSPPISETSRFQQIISMKP